MQSEQKRSLSTRQVGMLIVAFTLLMAVVGLANHFFFSEEVLPEIRRSQLDSARQRWQRAGVDDYAMDIWFAGGTNRDDIQVVVRDGVVEKMTRDGVEPVQDDVRQQWTVEKLFDMIAEDFDKLEDDSFRVREGRKVVLRGEFDAKTGLPTTYKREVIGASPLHSYWVIQRFEPAGG